MERGRLERARAVFTGLTVLAPRRPWAWRALGVIARRRGQLERAVGCLRHALELDGAELACRLELAEALLAAGDVPAARAELAHVIQGGRGAPGGLVARARALMARA